MTLICGADIGKQHDPAAFGVVDRVYEVHPFDAGRKQTVYWVLGMKRWDLGTDYTTLAKEFCQIVITPPLVNPPVGFDASGPGGDAFWDILKLFEPQCQLMPVGVVGGQKAKDDEHGKKNVSKLLLLSNLITLYASARIRVVESAEKERFEREVALLQPKITKDLKETIDTPRDGNGHCDIAMAIAIACWLGENTAVGWDGSIGMPTSYSEGGSVLSTAPPGVFQDMTGFKGGPPEKPRMDRLDENGLPSGYIPPWGPGW